MRVKQATAISSFLALALGCGGTALPPPKPDPYGPRVADCIGAPRHISDMAQERMVVFEGGAAVQGSTQAERQQARVDFGVGGQWHFKNEAPVRRAHVPGFRMDKTPVTNEAYAEFVEACGEIPPDAEAITPQRWSEWKSRFKLRFDYDVAQRHVWPGKVPPEGREKHPVVVVNQDQAAFYCAWRGGRLPSEAEWERAARGPQGNHYPWGNRFDQFRVNTAASKRLDTQPVGTLPAGASPEGILDMGGHVLEWTETPASEPGHFVVKGNGWDGNGGYGRGAARHFVHAERMDIMLGFRCAAPR